MGMYQLPLWTLRYAVSLMSSVIMDGWAGLRQAGERDYEHCGQAGGEGLALGHCDGHQDRADHGGAQRAAGSSSVRGAGSGDSRVSHLRPGEHGPYRTGAVVQLVVEVDRGV